LHYGPGVESASN